MSRENQIISSHPSIPPRQGVPALRATGAFTLIELLASITIIGVLASLVMGQVMAMRASARQLDCSVRMSHAGKLLFVYSLDHRDLLPYGGDRARAITLADGSTVKIGGWRGLRHGRWQALLPEVWAGPQWPMSLSCPRRPAFNPDAPAQDLLGHPLPFAHDPLGPFWMSEAVWVDPKIVPAPDAGVSPQQNHLSDVVFPSGKVYLFEAPGFCVSVPGSEWWVRTYGFTWPYRTSTLTMDGAVRRTRPTPQYLSKAGAFFNTPYGVRGRDELEP